MRVAFHYTFNDSDWLGGRNYYSSLFSAVRHVSTGNLDLVLIAGRNTATTLPEQFPWLEVVRTPMLDRGTFEWKVRQSRRLMTGMTRDPMFSGLLRQHRIAVLSHASNHGGTPGIKTLGWLPDFQFMHFSANWTARQLRVIRRTYRLTCKTSDALLLSSESALADLNAFAPWCTLPKHVLHFIPQPVKVSKLKSLEQLRAAYSLPARYVHLPNQFWVHKNHQTVIEALAILKQQGVNATVVCTGQTADTRRPEHFQSLMGRCQEAGLSNNFRVLGMVPYDDMQALMAHACCVINPSRFEGWSTTIEEAKAMRKDILLSDLPVHREQAPPGARYFSPDDPASLAALLSDSLSSDPPALNAESIERDHLERLAAFGRAYLDILARLQEARP